MMDANLMRLMSLENLLAAAAAEQDSLTRTPLETELIRRIEELQDERGYEAKDGTGYSADDLETLLASVIDDIDTTVALLEIVSKHRITLPQNLDDRLTLGKFGTDLADKLTDGVLTDLSVFFNQLAERK